MAVNGALKFLVLKVLSENEGNGSYILKSIEAKTGWKASPGSFYPLMQELVDLEFVSFVKESNIKTYSITEKGFVFLKEAGKKRLEIVEKIEEGLEFLKIIGEEKDTCGLIEKMKSDDMTLLPIQKFMINIDKIISKLDIKKNQKEINIILEETSRKLKELK